MSEVMADLPELDLALNMRVQQFYYHEAALLDDRPFIRKLLKSPGPPSPLAPGADPDAFSPRG